VNSAKPVHFRPAWLEAFGSFMLISTNANSTSKFAGIQLDEARAPIRLFFFKALNFAGIWIASATFRWIRPPSRMVSMASRFYSSSSYIDSNFAALIQ